MIVILGHEPQATDLKEALEERGFRDITIVETEEKFRRNLPIYALRPPRIFILAIIVRWTDPDHVDKNPVPEEVRIRGFHEAGFRCYRETLNWDSLTRVPVIFYEELDLEDVQPHLDTLQILPHVRYLERDDSVLPLLELLAEFDVRPRR